MPTLNIIPLYAERTLQVTRPPQQGPPGEPGGGAALTIQEEAVSLTQRDTLNFSGSAFTASDNAAKTRTDVTAAAALNEIASGTWTGMSSISTLGTITVGTWNGTAIGTKYGGLGADHSASTGVPLFTGGAVAITGTNGTGDFVRATGTAAVATLASTVAVADSTDATSFVLIADGATGAQSVRSDGKLLYDATTGVLKAEGISCGNAATQSAGAALDIVSLNETAFDLDANFSTVGGHIGMALAATSGNTGNLTAMNLYAGHSGDIGAGTLDVVSALIGVSIDAGGGFADAAGANVSIISLSVPVTITDGTGLKGNYTIIGVDVPAFDNTLSGASSVTVLSIRAGDNVQFEKAATVGGDLTVAGNFVVNGTQVIANVETMAVEDSLIELAVSNGANSLDIGFYGNYQTAATPLYCGFFWDASSLKFRAFAGLEIEPSSTVNTGGTGYTVPTLVVNVEGDATGNAGSASKLATPRNINGVAFDGTGNITITAAPTAHSASHQSGGSDAIKIDDLAAPDDNTDLNATTSAHGLLPKLSNVETEFLNGKGIFSTPAGGSGDIVSTLTAAEIAITNANTALTLSRWHAIKATSAGTTNALPTAVGNAGKMIGVRITTDSTKLVTLDGNSTETIDDALTRILWAGESALLMSDGAQWRKIAGKTIPMTAAITMATGQSVSATTWTRITLDTNESNPTGLMVNTGSNRIDILRDGRYLVAFIGLAQGDASGSIGIASATTFFTFIQKTQSSVGSPNPRAAQAGASIQSGGYATAEGSPTLSAVAGDYFHLGVYSVSTALYAGHGSVGSALRITEIPSW